MNDLLAQAPSRQAMHDLILPAPISLWPETPAWAAVGAMLAALLFWLGWRAVAAWRRAAYRREACAALAASTTPAAIAAILKRTALAAFPRADVASLSGAAWADFLRRTGPRARLSAEAANALAALAYAPPSAATTALRADAARWIRRHAV